MNNEEAAFKIVRLYFEEIARLGFKRQLDLDQILNSYFYTLSKLKDKQTIQDATNKANSNKTTTTTTTTENTKSIYAKNESNSSDDSSKPVEPKIIKETTKIVEEKPKEKTITDIIEEGN